MVHQTQEDDLKDADAEPRGKRWWHAAWVRHMCIWVPILVSACLLVTGIVLVVSFRGKVRDRPLLQSSFASISTFAGMALPLTRGMPAACLSVTKRVCRCDLVM